MGILTVAAIVATTVVLTAVFPQITKGKSLEVLQTKAPVPTEAPRNYSVPVDAPLSLNQKLSMMYSPFEGFQLGEYDLLPITNKIRAMDACGMNQMAITINDGPSISNAMSLSLLNLLKKLNLKVTFFVNPATQDSEYLQLKCNLLPRYLMEGHYIGCLGYDLNISTPDNSSLLNQQIQPCKSWVANCTGGYQVVQYSPPSGSINLTQAAFVSINQNMLVTLPSSSVAFSDGTFPNDFGKQLTQFSTMMNQFNSANGKFPQSLVIQLSTANQYMNYNSTSGQHFLEALVAGYSSNYQFVTTQTCWRQCAYRVNGVCTTQAAGNAYTHPTIKSWGLI